LLGIVALAVVVGTNFTTGFRVSGWNRPEGGWLSDSQRRELDALRETLESTDHNRPVVFVIDDEPAEPFQIWGFTKLSGNTSRYGLPAGQIDRGFLYLGSLDNYLSDRPTERGDETYDKLSPALLEDTRGGIQRSNRDPIVVVASAFNHTGANTDIASGRKPPAETDAEVWVLNSEGVNNSGISERPLGESDDGGFLHLLRVLAGLALLLLPGYLCLRYFVSQPGLPEVIGMVPSLALGILTLAGVVTLAVFRSPFSGALAAVALGIALLASGVAFVLSGRRPAPAPT
jgi:hypothetical protein